MAGLRKAIQALRPSDFAWAFGRAEARNARGDYGTKSRAFLKETPFSMQS